MRKDAVPRGLGLKTSALPNSPYLIYGTTKSKGLLRDGSRRHLRCWFVVCVDPFAGSGHIIRAFTREIAVLSRSEKTVLRTFRQYLVTPDRMLCFFGPNLEKHKAALQQLTEKDYLVKEHFKGAYSLTHAGFRAMKTCDKEPSGSKA